MRPISRTAIIALVLVLVAAACGDDDSAPATSTSAPSGTSASSVAPSSTNAGTPTSGAADSEVGDLLALYQVTPLRATYRVGQAEDASTIVLAQDPTATPPVESIFVLEADAKIIISEGTTILCDNNAGSCFELPGGGGESLATTLLGPFGSFLLETLPADVGTTTEEPITVAGRSGVCFTYEPPAEPGAQTDLIRQCIDDELGFTLLMQASDFGSDAIETVMELIDFAAPTPEDFALTGPLASAP